MTTKQKEYFSNNVRRGAAWLDENEPGWMDKIDLEELDMRSPCHCILGQLDSSIYQAQDRLSYPSPFEHYLRTIVCPAAVYWKNRISTSIELGFNCYGNAFPTLTQIWEDFILARRGRTTPTEKEN